jgi:Outer membrane protein transport protein (OMPP1/FadL/TodX)
MPKKVKMKKIIPFLGLLLSISATQAQDSNDAFRYSQTEPLGTARFRALSGAFGAVGGDLSAISINPASSSIFNNNQISITISNYGTQNNVNYFGSKNSESYNSFDMNQAGGVFVFENNHENAQWKKFAFSINYEKQNNFDNSFFLSGTNPTTSVGEYFRNLANAEGGVSTELLDRYFYSTLFDDNGNPVLDGSGNEIEDYSFLANYFNLSQNEIANNLGSYIYQYLGETGGQFSFDNQQAFLGFDTFILNPAADYDENNNRSYVSLVAPGGNYKQENSILSAGYNGKLAFNASANYQDRLMIGLNLNSHFVDYVKSSRFIETNNNQVTTSDYFVNRIVFNNDTYTYGNGFSFQLGAIYKLNDQFRIGGSYESPTWLKLTDELTQSISTSSINNTSNVLNESLNPGITMIYPQYTIQTPGKLTASAAMVFGKQGFLSIDYSSKDYSKMLIKPENEFSNKNNSIQENYTKSNELHIGGEYKIEKWSLRGGFRTESSPYKNKEIMGDLKGYSAGLGYNFGGTRLDFAYSTSQRDYGYQMFATGLTDRANVNTKNNNVTVTLAFEL